MSNPETEAEKKVAEARALAIAEMPLATVDDIQELPEITVIVEDHEGNPQVKITMEMLTWGKWIELGDLVDRPSIKQMRTPTKEGIELREDQERYKLEQYDAESKRNCYRVGWALRNTFFKGETKDPEKLFEMVRNMPMHWSSACTLAMLKVIQSSRGRIIREVETFL